MIGCHHITHHVLLLPSRYMMVRRGIISKWPKISSWCGCCNSARFILRIATLIHLKQHIPPESGYGSTCFCPPKCMVWDLTWPYFFHKFSFISHGCSRCSSKSSRDHDFVLKRLRMVTTGDLPWLVSTTCGLRCCSSFIIPDMLNVHSLRTGNSSSLIGKSTIRCNVQ